MKVTSYLELVLVPFVRARMGFRNDHGSNLVEYALLVALIAVVCILAVVFLDGTSPSTSAP